MNFPSQEETHPLTVVRKKLKKTQGEMAEFLECSLPTIRAIEQGKLELSEKLAWKISQRTGISLDTLLQPTAAKLGAISADEINNEAAEFSMTKTRTPPGLHAQWAAANLCAKLLSMLHSAALNGEEALFVYKFQEALKPLLKEFPLSEHIPIPDARKKPEDLQKFHETLERTIDLFWKHLPASRQEPVRPPSKNKDSHE